TKYPLKNKEINFLLRDNSSERIALRIRAKKLEAQIYKDLELELRKVSHGNPTVEAAVSLLKSKVQNSKNRAVNYLVAANILDSVGNAQEATRAASLALWADKSLESNAFAQFNIGIMNAKSGNSSDAEAAFARAKVNWDIADADPITVTYFSG